MNEKNYKFKYKLASCTKRPWEYLIPSSKRFEILRQVRQECIEKYGYNFDECYKRLVCFSNKCLGRPLEWDSPTARPYLEKFALEHDLNANEDYFIEGCNNCSIRNNCNYTCNEVIDFSERYRTEEVPLQYRENVDNYLPLEDETDENPTYLFGEDFVIPWDILTEQKKLIVKQYLYKYNDFKYIADKLNLSNQAYVKYEFYSALTQLSEYGIMRKFFVENEERLTDTQRNFLKKIYLDCKSYTEVADESGVSKQNVQQTVNRVVDKYDIKWAIFVKKEGNKIIYNVPRILK